MAPRNACIALLVTFALATAFAAITTTKQINATHHHTSAWRTT
jgi:hypothetical protein